MIYINTKPNPNPLYIYTYIYIYKPTSHATFYDSLTNIFLPATNLLIFSTDIPYVLATVAPTT